MIQHIWTIPCRVSLVDRDSNNVSLIQALEELTIPAAIPQVPQPGLVPAIFDVVTLWAREDSKQAIQGAGRMTLVSPSGTELLGNEYEIDLRENQRFRALGRIFGFPAQEAGKYGIRVERRVGKDGQWEQVALVPIWVNIQPRETSAAAKSGDSPR